MTHVLIAVDDSETSVTAARTAHHIFGDDARYTVINVASGSPVIWGDQALETGMVYPLALPGPGMVGGIPFSVVSPEHPDQANVDRVERAEQRAEDVAQSAGLPDARPIGDTGDAADAIIAAASEHHADVIVVGTHERNWFSRLFTSSVTQAVVRDSDVPVLVAR